MGNSEIRLFKSGRLAGLATALLIACVAGHSTAWAQVKVRVGHSQLSQMAPLIHGVTAGFFKSEGLDVELTMIQSGPANLAALAGGEIDIGWANVIPAINARANGVPLRFFLATQHEDRKNHKVGLYLVATEKSGVKSAADLAGKRVLVNANANACEIIIKENIALANVKWDDVQKIVLPFPQMEAALDFGQADVACTGDNFFVSIMNSKRLNAVVIAEGILPKVEKPFLGTSFYATAPWLDKNQDVALRFGRAFEKSRLALVADREARITTMMKLAGYTREQAIANLDDIYVVTPVVKPEDLQETIDAMTRSGLLKKAVSAAELTLTLDYK